MRSSYHSLAIVGGLLGLTLALTSPLMTGCGAGGGGGTSTGTSGGSLELVSFEQANRTDVARNQPLVFTFSTNVDPTSVSVDGFQLRSGQDVVQGRVVVNGRTLTYYPTVLPADRNNYNPPNNPPINGIGLRPSTRYSVLALANSPFSIKSASGRPLQAPFQADFSTEPGFLPEDPPVSPQIASDPIIFPDRVRPGGSFFGDPSDPNTLPAFDPTNIRITVPFSEAMDPGSFNPFTTFTLVNITPISSDPNCQVPALGAPIIGSIEPSPDATQYSFVPLFTLGDRPCTDLPFIFKFTVSPLLTDLAGNTLADSSGQPLTRPYVFYFTTIDKPGEPNFNVRTEDFSTISNRGGDLNNPTTACWAAPTCLGVLTGPPVARRTVDTSVGNQLSTFNLPQPLTAEGNRLQMLFWRDDFRTQSGGGAGVESFISLAWGPRSNYVFASNYPDLTMKLGHSRASQSQGLSFYFDQNWVGFNDNPTVVFQGTYRVPNNLNAPFWPWPDFQTDFEYSGVGSVVWEVNNAPGGDTYQLFRNTSTAAAPLRRIFGAYNDTQVPNTFAENTFYHMQFVLAVKKSWGVSRYYDAVVTTPDYTRPLVVFDEARGGPCAPNQKSGCYVVEWEGADATVGGAPDSNTATGFSTDINVADGHRFVRFQITINADPFSGIIPVIDSISFAYQTRVN